MQARSYRQAAPATATPGPELGEIKLIGVAHSFGRDQQIFGEGEKATYVYKVISGAVRSLRLLADGRRQITDFYLPGDVFGVELDTEHAGSAEAVGETVLIVARRSVFAADADFAERLWRHALAELGRSLDHVLTLGRRSAAERVASFLIDLAARLHTHGELTLPMTRQDIADYLGLTIETVSRSLSQLQAEGLIQTGGGRQVRFMRPSALAELCE
jgi:CRP/FNR family nitrogen fixation transcriptional regulator